MQKKNIFLSIILIFSISIAILIFWKFTADTEPTNDVEEQSLRFDAIDFSLKSPYDESIITLEDFKGKTLVVNFFATWCFSCQIEIPHFVDTMQIYQNTDVFFLGVNIQEDKDSVQKFAKEMGINYPIGIDSTGETIFKYGVRILPTTIFINKEGVVVYVYEGPLTKEQLISLVEYTNQLSKELA
jgi:peroxiredoxin|tara:strand:- start:1246 stop:1800 length:555 start_codon:yes stop_codon:yes gene_type:complete